MEGSTKISHFLNFSMETQVFLTLLVALVGLAVVMVICHKLKELKTGLEEMYSNKNDEKLEEITKSLDYLTDTVSATREALSLINQAFASESIASATRANETNSAIMETINDKMMQLNKTVTSEIDSKMQTVQQSMENNADKTNNIHKELLSTLGRMSSDNKDAQLNLTKTVSESMEQIRSMNEQKLNEINTSMQDKLDKSLNERLDSSFKQVGEQLGDLYKSLGELHTLSSGVNNLNKTLSNVKSRGIFGEQQLAAILENTMTPSQYETNVATKKNSSDMVEFAIKIPSKGDDKEFVLLPIDSKFPTDIYNKIIAASEAGDSKQILAATKELEQRIKLEARTIRDKYINPPVTTDFAVMFLPTESLYSEVLRIDGLTEWCQTNCKIIISGPTTITALLNSLRVGFSNLTLNKKTQEIIKVLQAIKTQYGTLSDLIDKTQKKLADATTSTEALKQRTEIIRKRMGKIEAIEPTEAEQILKLAEED